MSIRARLLLVNIGLLALAFVGMSLFAGAQITAGLRVDYEQRLISEISLIAQGIAPAAVRFARDETDDQALAEAFAPYEAQMGGSLRLYFTGLPVERYSGNNTARNLLPRIEPPEIEAVITGIPIVNQRAADDGRPYLYTAASVFYDGYTIGLLQLSIPTSALQGLIVQRWIVLVSGMITLTVCAAVLVGWIAHRMLRSLRQLQESAARLAKGELKHRIASPSSDEIGAVAHAFNSMAERIQSMLEAQQTFASNTSHEFRTPLTTIQLRTEALKRAPALAQDLAARQYLDEIEAEIARLTSMVQGFTLLARLDADRLELGRDEVDIVRFASALRLQMLPQAEAKGITLSLIAPDEAIHIHVNLAHLTLVFRNLLDNALKYTPKGGSVRWSLVCADHVMIHTLTDTGIGIAPEHLPHLFDRFYRADRARLRDVPGSGLGLSIVAAILRAYGGDIHIDSPGVNQGTTVTVRWRVQSPQLSVQP
ncbi:MAG: HAMP domain-containing histidine kinase [Anaerolineae bacterium]|nr:HAMP domain-containing histidine kinase [Anaerolineae bacterium]NUQ05286.1 HAMP domain-containing histidine kinase [Anaerolineae bacterium]